MSTTPPPPPPPPPSSGGAGPDWPPPQATPAARPVAPRPPDAGPAPLVPEGDQALARPVLTLWRVGAAIPAVVMTVPALVIGIAVGGAGWLPLVVVVALGVPAVAVMPGLRYDRWRWRMTGRALELQHGVLFRQVRALPYFRIQHIDVEHGPLDRWLGLARLEVHTASVTATLPGLPADDAPGIRAALLQFAASAVTGDQADDAV